MYRPIFIFCTLASSLLAQESLSTRVRQEVLDQQNPVVVNASTHGLTTLQFSAKIQALDGAYFTRDPKKQPGEFLVMPGINWCSVQSLKPGAVQNLNVIIGGKSYPIVIRTADNNDYTVIFKFANEGGATKTATPEPSERKKITVGRVLSLLDKAKGYPVFSEKAPEMYLGIDIAEPKAPKGVDETEQLKTHIVRILRDGKLDCLVFEVALENKTDTELRYDPNSLGVRAGDDVYTALTADGPGKIPPHTEQTAFFAIAGSSESGVPNNLSVNNDFSIILPFK